MNNSGASVVQFHWAVVIEHYPSESDTCTREGVRGHTHTLCIMSVIVGYVVGGLTNKQLVQN